MSSRFPKRSHILIRLGERGIHRRVHERGRAFAAQPRERYGVATADKAGRTTAAKGLQAGRKNFI
jgi:hypothetical protein